MIRPATVADIPALNDLLQEILSVHHEVRPDLFKARGQKFSDLELEELLHNPSKPIFVYELEGQVVGHLFCQLVEEEHAVLQRVKTLFIDDLCVKQAVREQAIGQQLYEYALSFAREQGCYNVTLDVWSSNEGAVAFYHRLGMREQKVRMERILE
ncbi:GNAT family N-acetyltransferase [Streptococcus cuniculi]|uniref:GNAT family N-acetyltransferase n=1 Tax=Streptococcus cuniculi TaxID=1432788 RepID=A0A4Y9JFQ4_9STRE|nr:GNAT family N-acetyltransferase [Streptococcus cuniculi]MBF0777220.1 GNAT family N-acetyltransferase [Streptococcus cuniculi]TFU98829.1 GNAT family N-acetyltransferase [Streptococcus cuniculi]